MPRKITIVKYDPVWIETYRLERDRLVAAIGDRVERIEHVGSTAVPGLGAKPIIDIMIGLRQLADAKKCIQPIVDLGYLYIPEYEAEMPERRYFKKQRASGEHTYHIHMVEVGSDFWNRHLLFRDYLRAHREVASEYQQLKEKLSRTHQSDTYTDAKADFIQGILLKAEQWQVLQQQLDYYRARAGEYDQWFYRTGRYDRGAEATAQWFAEVATMRGALHDLAPLGDVLELAAGTGIWTQELIQLAHHVTAIDASPEVIAINRAKLPENAPVTYLEADLFPWEPDRQYDTVFFAFWISHVPPEKLDSFIEKVARALKPGGRVFLIDSRREQTATAIDHAAYAPENPYHVRRLNDGREFQIVKIFWEPEQLNAAFARHGIQTDIQVTPHYFIYGGGVKK